MKIIKKIGILLICLFIIFPMLLIIVSCNKNISEDDAMKLVEEMKFPSGKKNYDFEITTNEYFRVILIREQKTIYIKTKYFKTQEEVYEKYDKDLLKYYSGKVIGENKSGDTADITKEIYEEKLSDIFNELKISGDSVQMEFLPNKEEITSVKSEIKLDGLKMRIMTIHFNRNGTLYTLVIQQDTKKLHGINKIENGNTLKINYDYPLGDSPTGSYSYPDPVDIGFWF